ncbi:MAG: aminoglycoside phosphotransferase family protein [Thermomicrobiales bacterium]|nr:aminoglycoside phosphotransferase family protein [Thermomicrobiales bacterium]
MTLNLSSLPDTIQRAIDSYVGSLSATDSLGGMSGDSVWRLRGDGQSAILKRSGSSVETYLYSVLSERLRAAGLGLPEMYASAERDGSYWLLLEDIPYPVSSEQLLTDSSIMKMLRRLHGIETTLPLPEGRYRPAWPEEMSQQALRLLAPADPGTVAALLDEVRLRCLPLFAPVAVIAGDPNITNWGLRDDGSVVLFDWERITLGSPAIDLAILVPGVGDRDLYRRLAASYLSGSPEVATETLALQIADAKVWSVIEFLAACARGEIVPTFDLDALLTTIPDWLRLVAGGE